MRSGTRFILAALPAAAFLLIPSWSGAGESPYTGPGSGMKPPPARQRDISYFCEAGNKGPSHTLYITPIHHLEHGYDPMTERLVDQAWTQAIHGQRDAYLPECQVTQTSDVQRQRQDVLAQPRERTVNIDWQYGQSGPAVASQ